MLDTVYNHTAKSMSSALITMVVRGSPAIFSRLSASNFYLEVEQMSVIHFLDTAKFNAILSLIRTNNAYNVSLNPATGRPAFKFTQVNISAVRIVLVGLSCSLSSYTMYVFFFPRRPCSSAQRIQAPSRAAFTPTYTIER